MARVDGSSSGRQRVLACASRLLTDDRVFAVKLVTLVLPLPRYHLGRRRVFSSSDCSRGRRGVD